ncbi:hypothetical protein GCM10009525_15880 [Streptosporangium amethystogenes subsp. fukuiense]
MKKLGKALQMVAVSGVLAAGALTGSATAAHATPSNCQGIYTSHTYEVFCYQGTGEFRAVVRCYKLGTEKYTTRYGEWKRAGTARSVATCTSTEDPASGYWQFR